MLPFASPLEPMLAQAQDEIPAGEGWLYEPKWDGFRAIVFREGDRVHLCSRNGQPLERYFPEVVEGLKKSLPPEAIVDGEIIIPGARGLDFEALSNRIHPAASRVQRLSKETPAGFVAFDCLALGSDDLRGLGTVARREKLIANFQGHDGFFVTPQTMNLETARQWFHEFEGAGCDGVIARRTTLDYRPGERVMVKIKHGRTADVVVVGYREGKTPGTVGLALARGVRRQGRAPSHRPHLFVHRQGEEGAAREVEAARGRRARFPREERERPEPLEQRPGEGRAGAAQAHPGVRGPLRLPAGHALPARFHLSALARGSRRRRAACSRSCSRRTRSASRRSSP